MPIVDGSHLRRHLTPNQKPPDIQRIQQRLVGQHTPFIPTYQVRSIHLYATSKDWIQMDYVITVDSPCGKLDYNIYQLPVRILAYQWVDNQLGLQVEVRRDQAEQMRLKAQSPSIEVNVERSACPYLTEDSPFCQYFPTQRRYTIDIQEGGMSPFKAGPLPLQFESLFNSLLSNE